jgi:mRNA-degrading endonuclease RelE of RelBE toxin-antitoxin system
LWTLEPNSKFIRQYKLLGSDIQKKVDSALNELANSENPAKLGDYKQNLRVYAYDLDKSNRIVYTVDFTNNVIELRRVGSHKQAYGKD